MEQSIKLSGLGSTSFQNIPKINVGTELTPKYENVNYAFIEVKDKSKNLFSETNSGISLGLGTSEYNFNQSVFANGSITLPTKTQIQNSSTTTVSNDNNNLIAKNLYQKLGDEVKIFKKDAISNTSLWDIAPVPSEGIPFDSPDSGFDVGDTWVVSIPITDKGQIRFDPNEQAYVDDEFIKFRPIKDSQPVPVKPIKLPIGTCPINPIPIIGISGIKVTTLITICKDQDGKIVSFVVKEYRTNIDGGCGPKLGSGIIFPNLGPTFDV